MQKLLDAGTCVQHGLLNPVGKGALDAGTCVACEVRALLTVNFLDLLAFWLWEGGGGTT